MHENDLIWRFKLKKTFPISGINLFRNILSYQLTATQLRQQIKIMKQYSWYCIISVDP